jgi:hypothetical protein
LPIEEVNNWDQFIRQSSLDGTIFCDKDTVRMPNLLEKFEKVINDFPFENIIENKCPVILRYNK